MFVLLCVVLLSWLFDLVSSFGVNKANKSKSLLQLVLDLAWLSEFRVAASVRVA